MYATYSLGHLTQKLAPTAFWFFLHSADLHAEILVRGNQIHEGRLKGFHTFIFSSETVKAGGEVIGSVQLIVWI